MRDPVQTAVCRYRATGTLTPLVDVADHVFVAGSYRLPVFVTVMVMPVRPPQTTIRVPVQTAVWSMRATGPPVVAVAVQASEAGL